jgi:hypothetical protein
MRWRKAALVRGENEGGAAVDKDYLALMRTALSRQSDEWNVDNFDVLADDEIVGRIFEANAALTGSPWLWTFIFPHVNAPLRADARGCDGRSVKPWFG